MTTLLVLKRKKIKKQKWNPRNKRRQYKRSTLKFRACKLQNAEIAQRFPPKNEFHGKREEDPPQKFQTTKTALIFFLSFPVLLLKPLILLLSCTVLQFEFSNGNF